MDYSKLPNGYVFAGRYQVVKALEQGSGGSVYLVRDTHTQLTGSKLMQCTTSANVVLKIFEGESQQRFFHKESSSLNKVKQCFRGQTFPGIVHMIDAVVLTAEPDQHQARLSSQ